MTNKKILLMLPPFTQLNTPYPSTCYLKRYLTAAGIECSQTDLSIELFLKIFSSSGLEQIFDSSGKTAEKSAVFSNRIKYTATIDNVISFLQNKNHSAAYRIISRNYLPESSRFSVFDEVDSDFHENGIADRARFMATLYIEDICDFITDYIDENFSISRYAEKTGIMANSFTEFRKSLQKETVITEIYYSLLAEKFSSEKYGFAAISIPFPGNLHFAFKTGGWIRQNHPHTRIIMGGGFVNTELREISNPDIFSFTDYITLDDGELPLYRIISGNEKLVRTFICDNGKISYNDSGENIKADEGNWSDYTDLDLSSYVSMIEIFNPMHRLWSEGHWNKMTLAHGCYWHKCAFCDTSLDYIGRYDPCSIKGLIGKIRTIVRETGMNGFHFTDEAAPPALLKNFCKELINENIDITWWTNIRFEKNFTPDLCRLMAEAGCIAVAGGIEVASERILGLINKGVTLKDAAAVSHNFTSSGIMTHAYLMFGFPTQTEQEIIDSLEVVRQMFMNGCISSAFWHHYTMTAHSPSGISPEKYMAKKTGPDKFDFAYNDLTHDDESGIDYTRFSPGLKKAVYNYMHGNMLDAETGFWFDFKTGRPKTPGNFVYSFISAIDNDSHVRDGSEVFWIGGNIVPDTAKKGRIRVHDRSGTYDVNVPPAALDFIAEIPRSYPVSVKNVLADFKTEFSRNTNLDISEFIKSEAWRDLRELGLIII